MREKIKCPRCGLVQWKEDSCKRCKFIYGEEAQTAPTQKTPAQPPDQTAPPPAQTPPAQAVPGAAPPHRDLPFGVVTSEIVKNLEKASPWMHLISSLGYIGALLYIGIGVLSFLGPTKSVDSTLTMPVGLLCFLLGIIYWAIFSSLSNSATAIRKIRKEGSDAVARAVRHQAMFWRLLGLTALSTLILVAALVLFMLSQGGHI